MSMQLDRRRGSERGMVLISSLLLLLIVTILAISMYRSFGIQEKISGNVREKQRALQAAQSAQQYAEYWLASGNGNSWATCNAILTSAAPVVCTNKLASFTSVPWPAGVTYAPPAMTPAQITTTAGASTYYQSPTFYISYLGYNTIGQNTIYYYQVDATAYGANSNTVAVVESTFSVTTATSNLGGP